MKRIILGVTVLLVCGSQPVWARTRVHDAADSTVYRTKLGGMIGRGALNVVTSPVDVVTNIVNETKAGPPFIGTLTGVGRGIGCGVLRLGSGAIDLVTFWVPGFNGFPVSASYDSCLSTSYSASASAEPIATPAASAWEVPTAEPGAAQLPIIAETEPPSKRIWKK